MAVQKNESTHKNVGIGAIQKFFYVLPKVPFGLLYAPMYILQAIYAKHYGLALTTIASVILMARLFDAVSDPIIGYLSDRYKVVRGSRKPFVVAGGCILICGGYFLYSPVGEVTALYFSFWFIAFYFGATLFQIPHLAWGGEISLNAHEKTQTFFIRSAAGGVGLILFYCIPLLPIWSSSEITPKTLHFAASVSAVLMLPMLYFCITQVSDGANYGVGSIKSSDSAKGVGIRQQLSYIVDNKPLLLFLASFMFSGIGLGMWYGLLFIFVDAYLGMGADFAQIYVISIVVGILASVVWIKIAKTVGKKHTWVVAMILGVISFIYTGFLKPESISYGSLMVLIIISTLCLACTESLPQSVLSDIVDYSTWKFRVYRGSTYFALYTFIYKVNLALGGALGLAIAGWYGFDPSSSQHTDSGIQGIALSMVWIPSILVILSIVFIAMSPITSRQHQIIRRRLDSVATRLIKNDGKYHKRENSHTGGTSTNRLDALRNT